MSDRPLPSLSDQDGTQTAMTAFVRITEGAAATSDHVTLAELTIGVLQDLIPHADYAYNVLEDTMWKNRAISPHVPPALRAVMRAGMPVDTPQYVQLFTEARPILSEWNAALAALPESEAYSSAGFYPFWRDGQPFAFLGIGITERRAWSEGERQVFLAAGRALQLALDRAWQAQEKDDRISALERRQRALDASRSEACIERDPVRVFEAAERAVLGVLPGATVQYWAVQDGAWHVHSRAGASDAFQWDVLDDGLGSPLLRAPRRQTQQQAVRVNGDIQGVVDVTLPDHRVWSAGKRGVVETVATHLGLALERAGQDDGAPVEVETQARLEAAEAFALGVWRDVARELERTPDQHDGILVPRLERVLSDAELLRRPLRLGLVGLRLLVEDVQAGLPDARDVTWQLGVLRPVRADREVLRRVLHELMEHAASGSGEERTVEVWSGSEWSSRVVSMRSSGHTLPPAVRSALVDGVWGPVEGTGLATVRRLIGRHGGRMWGETSGEGVTLSFTLPG